MGAQARRGCLRRQRLMGDGGVVPAGPGKPARGGLAQLARLCHRPARRRRRCRVRRRLPLRRPGVRCSGGLGAQRHHCQPSAGQPLWLRRADLPGVRRGAAHLRACQHVHFLRPAQRIRRAVRRVQRLRHGRAALRGRQERGRRGLGVRRHRRGRARARHRRGARGGATCPRGNHGARRGQGPGGAPQPPLGAARHPWCQPGILTS
mmetsp:Transcript_17551/g.39633  ORF Transcript_17551/g.39633 Transcript_17551/m.39633 type:complete len:206 (-) Transcript_17551:137-754(-)